MVTDQVNKVDGEELGDFSCAKIHESGLQCVLVHCHDAV